MLNWRVRFTPLADDDVTEAYTTYEAARGGLGEAFFVELSRAIVLLEAFPERGPVVYRDLRRVLLHRFPYSLYYRLLRADEVVEVRACAHQRRHPRTWRRRA